MAINYNAGFLPQQLYQNMFDAQRAGLEERNRRQREQYQNLGSIIGRLAKYNVDQGNQQLKDFEERYKTKRDLLTKEMEDYDSRGLSKAAIQDEIKALDKEYSQNKGSFNKTGFLGMMRDPSGLTLTDQSGEFPRIPSDTKAAMAMEDYKKQQEIMTRALYERLEDTKRTELKFLPQLAKAKSTAEIDAELAKLTNTELNNLKLEMESRQRLSKGQDEQRLFGEMTPYIISRLERELGARRDNFRLSIPDEVSKQEQLSEVETAAQKQRGQDAAQTELQYLGPKKAIENAFDITKYNDMTPGFITRFQQQEGVTTKALQQRGQDAAQTELQYLGPKKAIENAFDITKYNDMTPLVVERSKQIGDDEQRRKIDYLRESMGLDTGKAIALANLQSKLKKEELAYADKLKDLTPEEKEAKRNQRWEDGFKDFLDKLIPDGASDLEIQNAFKLAREMADETYGPRAGTVPIPNYDDLRSGSNAGNPPAAGGSGFIPKGGPTLSEGEIVEALELAETFPNNEGSRKVQEYASQYNTLLTRLFAETDPVKKQELQGQLQQLQAEAAPVLKDFRKDTIKDQATLKQLAKQDVRNTDNPPEDTGFLEKIGLTTPMDKAAKKVSEGTTTVKRQNAKTEAQAFAELTPEEQDAYNKRLEMADERMRSIGTMINSFRQFDRVGYGRGIRDNYVALRDALSKISDGFTKGEFKTTDLANPKSKLTKIYLEDIIPNYNILKNRIDDLRRNEEEMANQAKIQ
jgi:hypothetical protein